MGDLFFTLIDSLHCVQEDIRRHGTERLFWKTKDNKLWPRNEPEISKGIASYLSIYGALKNFDITCETIAGTGKIDFYVVAPVADGLGKVAIETKKAESNDLVDGFKVQLPDYMKRIGTDYGIYLVYWLKSSGYQFPSQFDSYTQLEIEKLHPVPRANTMRTVGMNLAIEESPSLKT
jgi:hypothetical protein